MCTVVIKRSTHSGNNNSDVYKQVIASTVWGAFLLFLYKILLLKEELAKLKCEPAYMKAKGKNNKQQMRRNSICILQWLLTLYTSTSVCIFSVLFSTPFPNMLTRRICLTIKSSSSWWLFPLFLWPKCVMERWYCKEKLDAGHSWGSKC